MTDLELELLCRIIEFILGMELVVFFLSLAEETYIGLRDAIKEYKKYKK